MCENSKHKKGFWERLDDGDIIIGDGGILLALEKRGYVRACRNTPEVTVEHPEALLQLHREFGRCGSNVFQAFNYNGNEDNFEFKNKEKSVQISTEEINNAACQLVKKAASEFNALTAAGLNYTRTFMTNRDEETVKNIFRRHCKVFKEHQIDFVICEFFDYVQEAVWAIQVAREFEFDVAATLCCNEVADADGVAMSECAVRMVNAGARCIGVNCKFDPFMSLNAVAAMKRGVETAELDSPTAHVHYMVQPGVFWTTGTSNGYLDLDEYVFALEPRVCTRFEIQKYARKAYELGIRYIGGCCGFEPYHIRAIAEELTEERGGYLPLASAREDLNAASAAFSNYPNLRNRNNKEYWFNLVPKSGRPEIEKDKSN